MMSVIIPVVLPPHTEVTTPPAAPKHAHVHSLKLTIVFFLGKRRVFVYLDKVRSLFAFAEVDSFSS